MVYIAKNSEEEMNEHEKPALASAKPEAVSAESESALNRLSPKTALIVGLAGSIMALCTVGFVVLLWLVFR